MVLFLLTHCIADQDGFPQKNWGNAAVVLFYSHGFYNFKVMAEVEEGPENYFCIGSHNVYNKFRTMQPECFMEWESGKLPYCS